ncbi:magnesium chelatase [Lacibacter luteus]|uniref:Magnesium chelatase n=1 Tax=Lacibacter luteus TaxID=2508719 RepID=A0A4Q1CNG0_9BACT|nr:magnesium chelatase [Lacibacter luteus]RXK62658.1 magnesium chelatase [Lacibacter luteus]
MNNIKTLGELKKSDYQSKSIKEEVRQNLIAKLKQNENVFHGILGYEDSVIPDVERALLSRHNILFLGLRGQAKTRMARLMTELLDDYIPIVAGSEVHDDPFHPVSHYAKELINEKGDDTPISWVHRSQRYGEKLATPDVSVADLIGDIDPIKAANMKLSFADERVIHYGIIPRSNRCVFVINEIPDLQARIQVSLFNILEEGDVQIRGFKLRLPLDILFVFTANPEDYTNRGSIVTPLKDRIESQILTHYPKTIETGLAITEQEAVIHPEQEKIVDISDLLKRIVEQVAFEARSSEYVDKKSGVSARLTISAYENLVSTAELRALQNKEKKTQVWMSDLIGVIPSITGKIELVYEGEQEGPYQVAFHLLDKAIRAQFLQYFPNPEQVKKQRRGDTATDNPYKSITNWFDKGNKLTLLMNTKDEEKIQQLYSVDGLYPLVKKYFKGANEQQSALLMEFVLHGLSAYSLISKKVVEGRIEFNDLVGSMINLGPTAHDDDDAEDYSDEDFN